MKKSLRRGLGAVVLGAVMTLTGTSPATAAAPAPHTVNVTFAGTVALDDCSGSLVRLPTSKDQDPALILTNGHCLETGMPAAGQVILNQPSRRSFDLLDSSGNSLATLRASKVVYATMTDTDITLYQLGTSYASIRQRYGISPLTVSPDHPAQGAGIEVVSGYWQTTYTCQVDGFVYRLEEGAWTWKDAVRYTPECQTIGGTSGSPVVDTSTGLLVAVNNTGNENGEYCTENNPCEVDPSGNVTIHQGTNYAEETYGIPACFAPGNRLDLTLPGCTLPRQ